MATFGNKRGDESKEGVQPSKVVELAKFPTYTKELSLEIYKQQIETQNKVNNDVFTNIKYRDLIESLKINKEISGLQRFVSDHTVKVGEKKGDQLVRKVLDILEWKSGCTWLKKLKSV